MDGFLWNPALLGSVFAVPSAVVDDHLKLAKAEHIKVLLYALRTGGAFDAAECHRVTGISEPECEEAVKYWIQQEVLLPANTAGSPASSGTEAQKASEQEVSVQACPAQENRPMPRPKAVKPQMREVIERRTQSPAFAFLIDTVSARIGKPLSPGDTSTLLYLYDSAGLPAEVIMMIVDYCVRLGKSNMRYIEKVALDWSDRGLDNMAAAEEYLCEAERRDGAWQTVSGLLGIRKTPSPSDGAAAVRWISEWKTPEPLMKLAHELCIQNTGRFSSAYISRILGRWHDEGVDTVEKALGKNEARKGSDTPGRAKKAGVPSGGNPSFDLGEYEEMVKNYTPVYKKKS